MAIPLLLWGAGEAAAALAGTGAIIAARDQIGDAMVNAAEGVSNAGKWVGRKIQSGIRMLSGPHHAPSTVLGYDQKTGRYINLPDATSVRSYPVLSSYFYPEEAPASNGATTQGTTSGNTTAPANTEPSGNNTDNQKKPSFRERLGDRIAGRSNKQTTGGAAPSNPDPNKDKHKILGWAKEILPRYGYSKTNWGWNIPRVLRDATYINYGVPTIANGIIGLNTGKTPVKFPLTSYIPGVFEDTTNVAPPATATILTDTVPGGSNNDFDAFDAKAAEWRR